MFRSRISENELTVDVLVCLGPQLALTVVLAVVCFAIYLAA